MTSVPKAELSCSNMTKLTDKVLTNEIHGFSWTFQLNDFKAFQWPRKMENKIHRRSRMSGHPDAKRSQNCHFLLADKKNPAKLQHKYCGYFVQQKSNSAIYSSYREAYRRGGISKSESARGGMQSRPLRGGR